MPKDLTGTRRRSKVCMGNFEIESNGRRGRQELVTMRSLQREVQSYREDKEKIMKSRKEILQSLNILQRQSNKDSGTNPTTSARQVTTSKFHNKRDDHGNDKKSRSVSRHHHSPKQSNYKSSCKFMAREQPKCVSYQETEKKA
jgi:hypothetical protein